MERAQRSAGSLPKPGEEQRKGMRGPCAHAVGARTDVPAGPGLSAALGPATLKSRNNPAVLRSLAAPWSEPQDCRWHCKVSDRTVSCRWKVTRQAGEEGRVPGLGTRPLTPRARPRRHPIRSASTGPGLRGLHGAHVRGRLLRAAVLLPAPAAAVLEQEAVQQGAQRGRG